MANSNGRVPADNVLAFIEKASDGIARFHREMFSQWMFTAVYEDITKSPIEDLFYVALHAMAETNFIETNPLPFFDSEGKRHVTAGIQIVPQHQIGNYFVDFLITYTDGPPDNHVVVELDGHDFHDKDKHQRSYEKRRDRYLLKAGYRVLHYTGSDVVADPYKVAHEVLHMLGAGVPPGYDANNPMGME